MQERADQAIAGCVSSELEEWALNEADWGLLSGSGYRAYGEGCVRLSFSNSPENITKALEGLRGVVSAL